MKKNVWLIALILLSVLPLIPLLHPGLPVTHDGKDHVARIANFFQNLQEGVLVPRWAGNLNWGYGHPVMMFLYPLPSYFASFFRLLGFSFIDSTKLVFASSYVLSGITMYIWLKSFLRRESAFLGSILYLFASYRFIDLYVRGALGEHVAFIFPPLICYFLYHMITKRKSEYALFAGIGVAGLILAHDAISIIFLPFIVIYACFLIFLQNKKKKAVIETALSIVLGFVLSSFFWIPAFFEGKYTLRDIVATHDFSRSLFSLDKYIYSPWSFGISGQFSLQIGIIQWVIVLLTSSLLILYRKKIEKKDRLLLSVLIVFFILTVSIMTPVSQMFWDHVSLIQKFQFPWRFLSFAVFITSVIAAVGSNLLPDKFRKATVILAVISVMVTIPYWKVNGYYIRPDSFFSEIYAGTTDTGESSPRWSVRFMEQQPQSHLEFISGKGRIEEREYRSTLHRYTVEAGTQVQLRENTVYFPGWKVLLDNSPIPIEFQDTHNRGVMTFTIPAGKHDVVVAFAETKLRFLADAISIFGLLIALISFILMRNTLWKRFQ